MANRFPLIIDTTDNKIKELPSGDSLDIENGGIRNASFIEANQLILNGVVTTPFNGNYADLTNKPTIPADVSELTDSTNIHFSGDYNDLTNKPTLGNQVDFDDVLNKPTTLSGYGITDAFDGAYGSLTGAPTLSAVATSGAYADLSGKPTLATVSATGAYSDLTGAPTIPSTLLNLGITDGLAGQVLTTDGAAGFTFTGVSTTLGGLTDVTFTSPGPLAGQVLAFNGSVWEPAAGGGAAIGYTDLSVAQQPPSGTGTLIYNNTNGVFTYTPPNLSVLAGGALNVVGNLIYLTGSVYADNSTLLVDGEAGNVPWTVIANTPTTVAGYGITDAIGTGNFTLSSSVMDTDDSSAITITPSVVMSSDLTIQNDLTVSNKVTAAEFVSNATGTPEIVAATNLNLTAGNAVIITSSPLRTASFTTTERNALSGQNGDLIYNTTDNKFQGYENGAWVNLV